MTILNLLHLSFIYLTGICISFVSCKVVCQDENGTPVDWLISYKLPQLKSRSQLIKQGVGYLYMEPTSQYLKFSNKSITDDTSAIGYTLQQLYNGSREDLVYLLYNDEHPDGKTTYNEGHTKGAIVFDGESGFWLVHSVPKFPPSQNESYSFPKTGVRFGQSFLCISLDFSQADKLGQILFYDEPYLYDFNIPNKLSQKLTFLKAVTEGVRITQPPWNQTFFLTSLKGQDLTVFAKHRNFNNDLYSSWMAPVLQCDLYVESWQNGPDKELSCCIPSCSKYTVENIKAMDLVISNVNFTSSHDHSKIAISKNSDTPLVCIGDINRMDSQKKRGGGSVCMNLPTVWQSFHYSIAEVDSCSTEWDW